MSVTRPRSIDRFERAFAATIALQVAYVAVGWLKAGGWLDQLPDLGRGQITYLLAASVGGILIHTAALYYAARRAGAIARAFVGILLFFRVFSYGRFLWSGNELVGESGLLMLFALVFHAVATWLLWRPEANDWFAGRWKQVDPDVFR